MRRRTRTTAALLAVATAWLSGCGSTPRTEALARGQGVTAIAALHDGGLRAAERTTGTIFSVDAHGGRRDVTTIAVSSVGDGGVLGLATDPQDRTFASWTRPDGRLVVGEVTGQVPRLIWEGPQTNGTAIGGRLTVTPQHRLLVGIGDLGDHAKASDPGALNGKLITLDPDRGPDQQPNVISAGWHVPAGVAYTPNEESTNAVLWAVDDARGDGPDRLARPGAAGPTGATELGAGRAPGGLTAYGDQELAVCERASHELRRFLIQDVTQAVPGRVLATDCDGGVAQLSDGRIAYSTGGALRVTAR